MRTKDCTGALRGRKATHSRFARLAPHHYRFSRNTRSLYGFYGIPVSSAGIHAALVPYNDSVICPVGHCRRASNSGAHPVQPTRPDPEAPKWPRVCEANSGLRWVELSRPDKYCIAAAGESPMSSFQRRPLATQRPCEVIINTCVRSSGVY